MRDNLARDVALDDLAGLVGLNRYYFCHAFRCATGYTPHQWLTKLRMDLARQLLAEPPLRIIDVALAVGYQTPSAFAARFRKAIGVTPTEFRRKL
jgi:AraC-like DNA-binding protein